MIGLDPDQGMLDEARRHAVDRGVTNISWVKAVAEDIPALGLPPMRAVTFGQSFHWTNREVVAEAVYDLLLPGGAIVLIAPDIDAGPVPPGPGDPPIPHDEINEVIRRYLGPERRAGQGVGHAAARPLRGRAEANPVRLRHAVLHAPAEPDIVRDIDGVISGYLSMSYAAPHLFGDRLDDFVGELRESAVGAHDDGQVLGLAGRHGDPHRRQAPRRRWTFVSGRVVIRRAGSEEGLAGALAEVLIDCVEGGASVSFMLPLDPRRAEAFWSSQLDSAARGERIVLVAEEQVSGLVVGTVQVILAAPENQPHHGEISKMLVHSRARRQGCRRGADARCGGGRGRGGQDLAGARHQ